MQDARAFLLGEKGRVPVALKQRQSSWKSPTATFTSRCNRAEMSSTNSRVRQMSRTFCVPSSLSSPTSHFTFAATSRSRLVQLQRHEPRLPFRKSGQRGARIAEHHAPGAEFIEQIRDQPRPRALVARQQFLAPAADARGFLAEQLCDPPP